MATISHHWRTSEYLTEKEFHKADELMNKGDFTKVIPIFLAKIDELKDNNELIMWVAYDLGCIYYMNDDFENSALSFKKSVELFGSSSSPAFAGVAREYAMVLKDLNQWNEAIKFYKKAKNILLKYWYDEESPVDFAVFQTEMAESYRNLGMLDEALENCLEAKKIMMDENKVKHYVYTEILNCLGEIHMDFKKKDEALLFFNEALSILNKTEETILINRLTSNIAKANNI